jgi:hypothetical protein
LVLVQGQEEVGVNETPQSGDAVERTFRSAGYRYLELHLREIEISLPITLVGLDPPGVQDLTQRLTDPMIAFNMPPRLRLMDNSLLVRPRGQSEFEPTE